MNQLSTSERARILSCLVDGCSIRSTVRITGAAKKTVQRLQVEIGKVCRIFHDERVRNLQCKRIECDEIWAFVYAKEKNIPDQFKGANVGDCRTWVGIDPQSKLIASWLVGDRDSSTAHWFVHDLKDRLARRVQLTTDGLKCYLEAVESAFGSEIDFAMLIKLYGNELIPTGPTPTEVRYSPPVCIGTRTNRIQGNPNPEHIGTSFVERQNLTMRMGMRRFTSDERIQQEMGESRACCCSALPALQLVPDSPDIESDASDGSGPDGPCLELGRTAGIAGVKLILKNIPKTPTVYV